MADRPSPRLAQWVGLVIFVGLAFTGAEVFLDPPAAWPPAAVFWVFAACAAVSELVPLSIPARVGVANETVSTTFVVALLLSYGAGWAIVAIAPVILVSDLIERKPAWKMAFNASQYALAIVLGDLVFEAVADGTPWSSRTIAGMLLAGLTFSAVNTAVVDVALALHQRTRITAYLLDQLPRQLASDAVLVAQAPVLVAVADRSLWLVPLVGLPAVVVFVTAMQSVKLRVQSRRTVETLAAAVDRRDPYTYDHSARVGWYAAHLARAAGLTDHRTREVESAGLVHDLGKIGVPDAVLLKPGPLDEADWCLMHEHPVIGEELLSHLDLYAGVRQMVRHHHERWDGAGYPDGLLCEQIPVGSRIIAIADTFDAMTTDRPYRPGLSLATALGEIRRCAGRQFDPQLAETFCRMLETTPDLVRSHARASRLVGSGEYADVPAIVLDASARG